MLPGYLVPAIAAWQLQLESDKDLLARKVDVEYFCVAQLEDRSLEFWTLHP